LKGTGMTFNARQFHLVLKDSFIWATKNSLQINNLMASASEAFVGN
jgi:hypothetical protein